MKQLNGKGLLEIGSETRDDETRNRRTLSTLIMLKMVQVVERGTFTHDHADRTSNLAYMIGYEMGIPKEGLSVLFRAGLLHDIGKVACGNDIILSDKKLSKHEMDIVKEHPKFGYDIIRMDPSMAFESEVVLQHHEWFDGGGYPNGVNGNNILLLARILSVADTYDALYSDRPYKSGWKDHEAMNFIKENKYKRFCPEVVDVFEVLYFNDSISDFYLKRK